MSKNKDTTMLKKVADLLNIPIIHRVDGINHILSEIGITEEGITVIYIPIMLESEQPISKQTH